MAERLSSSPARHVHIDVAKGLGIMLVVLGHGWWLFDTRPWLLDVITSFHLPLFLFLSGVFLRTEQPLARFAASRAHVLLKPYFVVLLALAVIAVALRGQRPIDRAFAMLYGNGETLTWVPMWFLPYIWTVMLATCWLLQRPALSRPWVRAAVLAGLAWGGALAVPLFWNVPVTLFQQQITIRGLPFSLDLVPIGCFFMLLGYALRRQLATETAPWLRLATWLVPPAFVLWHVGISSSLDLNLRRYDDPLLSTGSALIGIALIWVVSRPLARWPGLGAGLAYVGRASLLILIFHAPVQAAAWRFLQATTGPLVAALLAWGAGVLLPTLLFALAGRIRLLRLLLLAPPRSAVPS